MMLRGAFMLFLMQGLDYHVSMNWQALLDPDIRKFILEHRSEDIKALALKKPPKPEWPYALILDQIKAWQKAVLKCPNLAGNEHTILPAPELIEQASSQACAAYKASLVTGSRFADLTAGSGMDTIALAQTYTGKSYAVERNEQSAAILAYNLEQLGLGHVSVIQRDSTDFVHSMPEVDTVLIDPQRREGQKRGIFALEDCSPNIIELMPSLKGKAKTIILKTSPVLDISKAIEQIGLVSAVHIVQHKKECKELLFIITPQSVTAPQDVIIYAVHIDENGDVLERFTYTELEESATQSEFSPPLAYLYEPGPAFQKSGAFKLLGARYALKKLHPNTHLYTSDTPVSGFPGRQFEIIGRCAVQKKSLKEILPDMKASLSIRNFNMRAEDLRKKLDLSESDIHTVFACEILPKEKCLILCRKYTDD